MPAWGGEGHYVSIYWSRSSYTAKGRSTLVVVFVASRFSRVLRAYTIPNWKRISSESSRTRTNPKSTHEGAGVG